MILGIDEVGRGPWAGPLLVGAVVWPDDVSLDGLTDSKKLSAKKREQLSVEILEKALSYGFGEVAAKEIDEIGLSRALNLATFRAVENIKCDFDQIIIDGTINFLKNTKYESKVSTLKKADLLVSSVSAASIIAKVKRDSYMKKMSKQFPEYGFDSNVGYGTKKHIEAIEKFGVTPLHRLSFAPLAKYRQPEKQVDVPIKSSASIASNNSMKSRSSTKQIGDTAENMVANFLEKNGHYILKRNFKTKWYEIDIISLKNKTIYFTEVKYRKNSKFGGAENAISATKQKQMNFAAELFLHSGKIKAENINEYSPILAVGLVSGDYQVKDWFTLTG